MFGFLRWFKRYRKGRHVVFVSFPNAESYEQFASHLTVILRAGMHQIEESEHGFTNPEWEELVLSCLTATIRLSDPYDKEAHELYVNALRLNVLKQVAQEDDGVRH